MKGETNTNENSPFMNAKAIVKVKYKSCCRYKLWMQKQLWFHFIGASVIATDEG